MIGALMGLPGKVKAIADYLTTNLSTTRAPKIDYLDASISTRAAASTALTNATWTDAKSNKLTNAAQEDSPLLDVPIASGIAVGASLTLIATIQAAGLSGSGNNTTNTFSDAINYTGAGVVEFCAVIETASAPSAYAEVEMLIDGVSVCLAPTAATQYSTNAIVGTVSPGGIIALGACPFKTSLQIRHRISAASGATSKVFYKLRKTA